MAKKRRSTYEQEANLDALLRYGPQYSTLQDAMRVAQATYGQAVDAARTNAASIQGAVDQAVPQVQGYYKTAGQDRSQDQATLNQSLQNLPGANPTVLAAIAAEQARSSRLAADTQAGYLSDLAGQKTRAAAGRVYAQQKAQMDLQGSIAQILQKKQDLDSERGTYTALTAQQLRDKAAQEASRVAYQQAQLAQKERNSIRSSGIDPNTGQPIPGGRLDPNRPGGANAKRYVTQNQQRKAGAQIQSALQMAKILAATHGKDAVSIDDAVLALTRGRKGAPAKVVQLHDPKTGKPIYNPDGTPKTHVIQKATQAFDPVDELLARAAAEQAYYGYISKATQKRLQANGLKIGPLGVTSYNRRPRRRPGELGRNSTGSGLIP